jgi:type VI secretion system protein ImpJ
MPQKPHWPLGLDLGPHVFQFQDRYHEELIAERFAAFFDYAWGISELEWDTRGLTTGQVMPKRLRAILPDGTPIACDAGEASCPARVIRDLGSRPTMEVYLAVPKLGTSGADANGKLNRYAKERTIVPDFTTGGDPVELDWLRPNLELLVEGEKLERFTTLACARLVRTTTGGWVFDAAFVPPVLSIATSTFLEAGLRRLLDGLSNRRLALRRAPPRATNDSARQWVLSLVSGFIPRLVDVLEQRAHPHLAYRVVVEALGALAAFTPRGDVAIPAFDFDHLGDVFSNLFHSFQIILDALGAEQYQRIPLVASDQATLYAVLKEAGIFRKDFYVAVAGDDLQRIRAEVPRMFKIAAWNDLARVLATHSKGVTLEPQQSSPAALPDTPGSVYFRLEKNEAFSPIYKTGELGLHHGGLPGVREILLYAVDPVAP